MTSMTRKFFPALPLPLALAATEVTSRAVAFRTAGGLPEFEGIDRVRWASGRIECLVHGGEPGELGDFVVGGSKQAFAAWVAPACAELAASFVGASSTAGTGYGPNTIEIAESGWDDRFASPLDAGSGREPVGTGRAVGRRSARALSHANDRFRSAVAIRDRNDPGTKTYADTRPEHPASWTYSYSFGSIRSTAWRHEHV